MKGKIIELDNLKDIVKDNMTIMVSGFMGNKTVETNLNKTIQICIEI